MSDVKEMISSLAKNVTKTSSGIIKTTKLSMAISSEESQLNTIYTDIGKKVHEIYAYGGSLGKVFDEKYREIIETEERLKNLRSQLDMAKGTKTCPFCGKVANKDSDFCPRCGKNMGDTPLDAVSQIPPMSDRMAIEPMPMAMPEPIPEPIREREPEFINEITPPPAKNAAKICSICGSSNDPKDRFCLSCGRVL